jgi:hypothetical protein
VCFRLQQFQYVPEGDGERWQRLDRERWQRLDGHGREHVDRGGGRLLDHLNGW